MAAHEPSKLIVRVQLPAGASGNMTVPEKMTDGIDKKRRVWMWKVKFGHDTYFISREILAKVDEVMFDEVEIVWWYR